MRATRPSYVTPPAYRPRLAAWVVGVCFFVSGATGLIYQNVWVRLMGLFYGNTTLAVSSVVAAFMAGLALGAWLIGGASDRVRRPLALYGLLEILIGAYGLLSPRLLDMARGYYVAEYGSRAADAQELALVQFGLCSICLVFPTALMGATLPILSAGLQRVLGDAKKTVGQLYSINTFGAVLGTFLTAFVLLRLLGVSSSIATAAALNGLIGVVMILYSYIVGEPGPEAAAIVAEEVDEYPRSRGRAMLPYARPLPAGVLMLVFFATGLSGLTLEVAWTRTLCMFLGSSVYGFAIILGSILIGIALGSYLFVLLFSRRVVTPELLGWVAISIGFSCLALSVVFPYLPYSFLGLYAGYSYMEPWVLYVLQFGLCLLVTLAPTTLMGMTFPIVAKLCADQSGRVGSAVGKSYAANTTGAILGSALSALLFIPVLGLQGTVLWFSSLYVIAGVGVLMWCVSYRPVRSPSSLGVASLCMLGVALAAAVLGPVVLPWSKGALTAGVFRQGVASNTLGALYSLSRPEDEIIFYEEGTSATVSVTQTTSDGVTNKSLAVNGKTDASTLVADTITQYLTGHLPVLLNGSPDRCLLIGLGSGSSAAAMTTHEDVSRVEVAELEEQVVEGAKLMYEVNRGVLEPGAEPKLEMRIMDGRTALLGSEAAYDVVISEPSNPWISGVSNLFTVEHYEACKRALKPTGTYCQWAQAYELDERTMRMMFATVHSVFPDATVWRTTAADYLFIARMDNALVDYARLVSKFKANPALTEDLEPLRHASPGGILACYVMGPKDLAKIAKTGEINTDDMPLLEFWAPRGLYHGSSTANFDWIQEYTSSRLPEMTNFHPTQSQLMRLYLDMAAAKIQKSTGSIEGLIVEARDLCQEVLDIDRHNAEAYTLLGEAESLLGNDFRARIALERSVALDPRDPRPRTLLANLLLDGGLPKEALREARVADQLKPNDREITRLLSRAKESAESVRPLPSPR